MLTATKDRILPTTVTGSWPRPSWYTHNLQGRAFSDAMGDVAYREQFVDAVSAVLADQERAGLDILTNGDYHLDADHAGRSWFIYPTERLSGMSRPALEPTNPMWSYPVGTWLNDIVGGWKFRSSRARSSRGSRSSSPRSGASRRAGRTAR
jgi:5-methyltetrahydropteroyltriglutamate--homocysteine methyltransferase